MRIKDFHMTMQKKDQSEDLMAALKRVTLVKDFKRIAGRDVVIGWIPWDHGYDPSHDRH